ncbi:hypothetical protein [Streptomyces sp. NPDC057617]|uniref:hypothetical protein n=1 Tax=unclassified Streptomyces TaxID=2593676 RepID=UPI003680C4CE
MCITKNPEKYGGWLIRRISSLCAETATLIARVEPVLLRRKVTIKTGTDSYRLASTRASAEEPAKAG